MTDQGAHVTKHYRFAKAHLEALRERRRAAQALHEFWLKAHAVKTLQPPPPAPTEEQTP